MFNDKIIGVNTPRQQVGTALTDGATTNQIKNQIPLSQKGARNGVAALNSNAEIEFSDSGKGLILSDRTNGNNYRLLVNNGTLSVEQV